MVQGKDIDSKCNFRNFLSFRVVASDLGTYTVRASNNIGTSVSKPVRLTILFPPRIVSQPSDVVVRQGAKAQFVVKSKVQKLFIPMV